MPVAPLNDAYIHYALEGEERAPALVLVNSLGTDLHLWDPHMAGLTREFRVLRFDARGHGGSTGRPGAYSLDDLGGDVVGLMDYLNIRRAHVCGISLGGMTALWMAIHAPSRVNRVMACNTASRIGSVASWNARIQQIEAEGLGSIADGTMERWFTQSFRERSAARVAETRRMFLRTYAPGYMACCAALRDADLTPQLGAITAPTLVVSGSVDPVTPPADGHALTQAIPGAAYVELEAAHLSNVEQADAFLRAMLSFLW